MIYQSIISRISFIDDKLISEESLSRAIELVQDIDENDALFIALGIHFKAKIWSGDKKLKTGLEGKGSDIVMGTEELYQLFLDQNGKLR